MHERSLALSLIRQIDDELRERGLHQLSEVRLAIGEFAGVEPALLASAFEELAAAHWESSPRLRLDIVPLTARCHACGQEFNVHRFRFVCPQCGSQQTETTAGEELQLVSVRAETLSAVKDAAS